MAYGQQIPGRYTRRRSPAENVTTQNRLRRFYPLASSASTAADYGVNACNAATVASEYFWGAPAPPFNWQGITRVNVGQSVSRASVY